MEGPFPLNTRQSKAWSALKGVGIACAAVVVSLVLVGQGMFLVRAFNSEHSDLAVPAPAHGTLQQRLDAVLTAALGPGDRGVRRYRITRIAPDPDHPTLRDVDITWAINNDLAAGSVGNGAEADVYTVLRDLYTASLPLGLIRLSGTYPQPSGRGQESVVMRLSMDRHTARLIGEVGWDTMDPETVWPLVTRKWVAPEVQPISGG